MRDEPWPNWILEAPRRGVVLYRLFDADRRLLYIGVTANAQRRLKKHWHTKPWCRDVVAAVFEQVHHRDQWDAEATAIRNERPKYNLAGITVPYWVYDRHPSRSS